MKRISLILILFSTLLIGCSDIGMTRYTCQEFENWDEPYCNPPACYQDFTCTKDLFPQEFWDNFNTEAQVPNWINENFLQYVADQNYRYINALFLDDKEMQDIIKADAEKVGYDLIPSKYLGGLFNEEQVQ